MSFCSKCKSLFLWSVLCVPDCGFWSLLHYKLIMTVVLNIKTRHKKWKKCRAASNWLRTKLSYQRIQGSPISGGEWISLGVCWSLWPMQKDFGGTYSSFYLETAFHTAEPCLPQQQGSPVEMQKSELGHRAWLMLLPSEPSGRPVVEWNTVMECCGEGNAAAVSMQNKSEKTSTADSDLMRLSRPEGKVSYANEFNHFIFHQQWF